MSISIPELFPNPRLIDLTAPKSPVGCLIPSQMTACCQLLRPKRLGDALDRPNPSPRLTNQEALPPLPSKHIQDPTMPTAWNPLLPLLEISIGHILVQATSYLIWIIQRPSFSNCASSTLTLCGGIQPSSQREPLKYNSHPNSPVLKTWQ